MAPVEVHSGRPIIAMLGLKTISNKIQKGKIKIELEKYRNRIKMKGNQTYDPIMKTFHKCIITNGMIRSNKSI